MTDHYALNCPFCDYKGPSPILHQEGYGYAHNQDGVFVIEPINPVVPGHVLVIPHDHVVDFRSDTGLSSLVFQVASAWARSEIEGDCNIISSAGPAATQTIKHLHVHVVPRREGDGLLLPWSCGFMSDDWGVSLSRQEVEQMRDVAPRKGAR